MAWVANEHGDVRRAHDFLKESMRRADAMGNDIVKCTSRIDLAGNLIFGGHGQKTWDRAEVSM
jgi:hypothetical protein